MALDIIITNGGRAAIVNAQNNGTDTVLLTHVAFGTGQYNASASRTQLQNEVQRVSTISGNNINDDTIHVTARDESTEEYDVGEVGVFTDDGVLFAVYSSADSLILQKTASSTLLMAIDIALKDLDANVVSFGDTNFTLPPASTTVQGVVEKTTDAEALAGAVDRWPDARAVHLAFGQYGLGTVTETPPGNNLNVTDESVPTGMYQIQPGTTGNPISTSGNVLWMRRNANGGEAQLLFSESGGRMLFRTRVSGGWTSWREPWHDQNMGSGSGLDADELDGQHGSYYRNAGNMNAGTLPAARLSGTYNININGDINDADARTITFDNLEADQLTTDGQLAFDASQGLIVYRSQTIGDANGDGGYTVLDKSNVRGGDNITLSGNDTNSSGTTPLTISVNRNNLDADKLDGQHGSYYRDADNLNSGTVPDARLRGATISQRGVLQVADNDESEALTRDDRIITPLRLARAFQQANQDLAANGFQRLPGGMIMQWGLTQNPSTGVEVEKQVSFPVSFPSACLSVMVSYVGGLGTSFDGVSVDGKSRQSFTLSYTGDTPGNSTQWLAIGY